MADNFFNPRSLAVVGATDRSRWSQLTKENLEAAGFTGRLHMVNRRGGEAHGQRAAVSCAAIGEPVDLALLVIPSNAIVDALDDLAAAQIRHAVVVASGMAEAGAEGQRLQEAITDKAHALGITMLGPNCLGFMNFADCTGAWTATPRWPALPGSIALVSQSGATANFTHHFAYQQGIGLTHMISTGNESMLDVAGVIDELLEDARVKVIAAFLELVRDPVRFRAMAQRASSLGKPLVMLKAGRTATAAAAATAHTGALVGDDTVFTGLCRQYGILKVRSVEELVVTADVLSKVPVLSGSGIGYLSISGGLCEIGADLAEEEDLTLPALQDATAEKLRGILPSFATVQNPLDMTANVTSDPSLFERVVTALGQDRGLSLLVCIFDVPTGEGDIASFSRPSLQHIGRALHESAIPLLVISTAVKPVTAMSRQIIAEYGLPYISGGIDLGLRAIREATRWSAYQRNRGPTDAPVSSVADKALPLPRSEFEARGHLESFGVPLVPAALAATPAEAVGAAQRFGGPVVMKIASPDIAHKTEIGGVVLNLEGEAAVAHAFHDILTRARHARPQATIEGILVSPMRKSGVELLVGITRDPQWGLVLTLGIGGIWVELLKDVSTRLLPVTVAEVLVMLEELRAFRLLAGYRGVRPVNLARLAQIIVQIGDAARALGPRLHTLEINPLLAQGDTIEALDALVVATDS